MRLDLVIPARNEAANIQDALRRLITALRGLTEVEWGLAVVVNGTTDDTIGQIEQFKKTMSASPSNDVRQSVSDQRTSGPAARVVALICPGEGKGAAIRFAAERSASPTDDVRQSANGWSASPSNEVRQSGRPCSPVRTDLADMRTADPESALFGFIDADLSADPDMIVPMVRAILADEADVVIGSRLLQTRTTNRGWLRTLSSRLFNLAVHLSLGLKVKDAQCGLKIMNSKGRKTLMDCRENGWFLDIEFLTRATRAGLRIKEVPVPWLEYRYPDRRSQVSMAKDGIGAIKAMLRIRREVRRSDGGPPVRRSDTEGSAGSESESPIQ